jgi:hypothetical protein
MIVGFFIIVAGAAAAWTISGGPRPFKFDKGRVAKKTPSGPVVAQPATYFERYMPKKTSGQGEPI